MEYLTLDLELFDHRTDATGERFLVRVIDSPAGSPMIDAAEEVRLPADIRQRTALLASRGLTLGKLIELGSILGSALFPAQIRDLLIDSLLQLRGTERLRLQLRFHTYALASLPWEYSYIPQPDSAPEGEELRGFLALDLRISFVRYELVRAPKPRFTPLDSGASARLAVLLANPNDPRYRPLQLEAEERRVLAAVRGVEHLEVQVRREGTRDAFEDLCRGRMQVFHFAGHGEFVEEKREASGTVEGRGQLILVGESGAGEPFPAERLARNLKQRGVRLVVLSACEGGARDSTNPWTGVAAALMREGMPAVVAMQLPIADAAAIEFSESFYRTLLAGETIDAAVADGRQAIANACPDGDPDWGAPVLYLRSTENAVLFPTRMETLRTRRPPRRYVANLGLFTLVLIGFGVWAYRHLYYLVLPSVAPHWAGLAGLFTFVMLLLRPLFSLFGRVREGAESRIATFLATRHATVALLSGAAAVLGAFGITFSYYLIYDPDSAADGSVYRVEAADGAGGIAGGELRADRASFGAFRLFRWTLGRHEFRITSPALYEPRRAAASPLWQTAHLRVPSSFDYKASPLLHIVPTRALARHLSPSATSVPTERFDLILEGAGVADTLPDVRFQSWVIARDAGLVEALLPRDGTEPLDRVLDTLFPPAAAGPDRVMWRNALKEKRKWITQALRAGTTSLRVVGRSTGDTVVDTTVTLNEHTPPEAEFLLLRPSR